MSDTTDIGEAVQQRLQESRRLADIVGGRIRPDVLDQKETLPAIKYETMNTDSQSHLRGASGEAFTRLGIDCYGKTRREANRVAAVVVDVLHGYHGQINDSIQVFDCLLDNKYDRRDPPPAGSRQWRYRRVLDFLISHTEPQPTLSLD